MTPTQKWLLFGSIFLLVLLAAFAYSFAKRRAKPLAAAPQISFPAADKPTTEIEEFLSGDFAIVNRVELLPKPVRLAFTEANGSRLTMADPGEKFQATDVVMNPQLPRRRLILAGVSGEKTFVQYERGGIGPAKLLALFKSNTTGTLEPVWQGYCQSGANDLAELREQIKNGDCKWRPQYGKDAPSDK